MSTESRDRREKSTAGVQPQSRTDDIPLGTPITWRREETSDRRNLHFGMVIGTQVMLPKPTSVFSLSAQAIHGSRGHVPRETLERFWCSHLVKPPNRSNCPKRINCDGLYKKFHTVRFCVYTSVPSKPGAAKQPQTGDTPRSLLPALNDEDRARVAEGTEDTRKDTPRVRRPKRR